MSILVGHPTGNPNSHNAAAAYFEAGLLEGFCVSWMPASKTTDVLKSFPPLRQMAERLERRQFLPLASAPKVQGKAGEFCRLLMRASGLGDVRSSDRANRWLMRTMARECRRPAVTAVHAYEDCSLWQFKAGKRLGKACVYDLPTCYYPAWEKVRAELKQRYADWVPPASPGTAHETRLEQKRQEMALADLVLVASRYVEGTIREYHPCKDVARAPYGVDTEFWAPGSMEKPSRRLRFIYAGQVSVRKGIPWLIDAWVKAELRDAELALVGSWALADGKRSSLPPGVRWIPPCSSQALRDLYRDSNIFVFPSFSDGFGLVLLEAMACGLPVIASETSAAPEIVTPDCGFVATPGDLDRLVELLRWFDRHRDDLPAMGRKARLQAARYTWGSYRHLVTQAVSKFA
jgi:glycosyltransferase involved in cell wall biosynthesis